MVYYISTAHMTTEKRPATRRDLIKGPTTCLHIVWVHLNHLFTPHHRPRKGLSITCLPPTICFHPPPPTKWARLTPQPPVYPPPSVFTYHEMGPMRPKKGGQRHFYASFYPFY